MSKDTKTSKQRLDMIDGLKGLSMLSIIIYYFFEHILPGGYLAVNTFLLIAGFFNFRHFTNAIQKGMKVNYLSFIKKRLSRLFFPMLAMIITVSSFILLFARGNLFNLRNMGISSLLFINNYYQIWNEQSYFVQAANPSPFIHLWYVGILGQLILLTPLLILLFYSWHKKQSTAVNMLSILTIVSAFLMGYSYKEGQDPTGIYYSVFTRAFAYTAGGVVGLLLPTRLSAKPIKGKIKWIFNGFGTLLIILLFLMSKFMYGTQPFAYRFGMSLFTLVSGFFLLVSIHPSTIWNKILSLPPLTFIGKRSYSYYLLYYPVYIIMPNLMQNWSIPAWSKFTIQFIIIIILAEISYRLFEQTQISLPIGQDFNLKKSRYQFDYLRKHKGKLINIKVISTLYIILLVLGTIGIFAAPEERAKTAEELQTVIEENQQLADQTQTTDTENVKIVNNIEGLEQQEMLYANGLDITFVGDSILLASANHVQNVFPKAVINGEVGRQLYNSVWVINYLKDNNLLKPTVVTILGSNGTFTESQLNDYINAIGANHDIFFVTSDANRAWVNDANQQLVAASQRFGNVHIIDWASYANDQVGWQREDEAHPTDEGAKELSSFIAKEIYRQR
ncbi:acyltransferase family protein [Aerococcaceae bacterium WGS1372]